MLILHLHYRFVFYFKFLFSKFSTLTTCGRQTKLATLQFLSVR